jgi:guanylate kinase
MNDKSQLPARRGLCLILSSPSGAGKTTLARLLLQADETLAHSISVTTRSPRPQEQDGADYFFVSRARFEELRKNGELLEWAEVFGNFYGTPKKYVEQVLAEGRDIIFDVDWQGASSIASSFPEDTVRVFILPPSAAELSRRINARGSDSNDVIQKRLKAAADEIAHWAEYDYVLVNHEIGASLDVLRAILVAERYRRHRRPGLAVFTAELMRGGSGEQPAQDG